MGCTYAGHKSFLTTTNIGLLIIGLVCTGLGIKMKTILDVINIGLLTKVVKAVIAAGFIMTITGISGCAGACYEVLWMLCVHLAGLGIIVIIEFAIGVTVMVVKNTLEALMDETSCDSFIGGCQSTLKGIVRNMVLPSAGIMLFIIIIQALMIYSAVKLIFHFRERPKDIPAAGPTIVVQNVQMSNMGGPPYDQPEGQPPGFPQPPQDGFPLPPQSGHAQPPEAGFVQPPQMYAPEAAYTMYPPPEGCSPHPISPSQPIPSPNQPCATEIQPPPPPYSELEQGAEIACAQPIPQKSATPQMSCVQSSTVLLPCADVNVTPQILCQQQQSQTPKMDVAASSTPTTKQSHIQA